MLKFFISAHESFLSLVGRKSLYSSTSPVNSLSNVELNVSNATKPSPNFFQNSSAVFKNYKGYLKSIGLSSKMKNSSSFVSFARHDRSLGGALLLAVLLFFNFNANAQTIKWSTGFETGNSAVTTSTNGTGSGTFTVAAAGGVQGTSTRTGTGYARIDGGANNVATDGSVLTGTTISFTAGKYYKISFFARVAAVACTVKIAKVSTADNASVKAATGGDQLLWPAAAQFTLSGGHFYGQATFQATVTESKYVGFYLRQNAVAGSRGRTWLDDIQILESDYPFPCAPEAGIAGSYFTLAATDYINSFSLNTLSNSNSGATYNYGYQDFMGTVASTTLNMGTTYSGSSGTNNGISLTSGAGTGSHSAALWIDYNKNGTFETTEYTEIAGNTIGASSTVAQSITIPSSGISDGKTSMRVRYEYNTTVTNAMSCQPTAVNYGEIEDYVVCLSSKAPTGALAGGNSPASFCSGNMTLTQTGGILATGATWKWYSTSCGGTLVGTSTAADASLTITAASGTYYVRAEGACGNTTCASVAVTLNTVPTCITSATPTGSGQSASGVTLSWGAVSGATSYDVYFGTDGGGTATPTNILNAVNQAGTSYSTGALSGSTTYYFQIVPKNSCGSATGCTIYSFTTAAACNAPTFTATPTNPLCNSGTGSINVSASGGISPYQYSNDNGSTWQSGSSFAGLAAGAYLIVVKGNDDCTAAVSSTTVSNPTALTASVTSATLSGCSGSTVSLGSSASGGTGSLSYSWSPTTGLSSSLVASPSLTITSSQTYTLSVTDANGCTSNQPTVAVSIGGITKYWYGLGSTMAGATTSNNFNLASNWSSSSSSFVATQVPTSCDDVYYTTVNGNSTLTANATVKSLTMSHSGNGNVFSLFTGVNTFEVLNATSITVTSGNLFTDLRLNCNSGTFIFNGDFVSSGAYACPVFSTTAGSGVIIYRGNVTYGTSTFVYSAYLPQKVIFDGTSSQSLNTNSGSIIYMPTLQIGGYSSNSPVVTIGGTITNGIRPNDLAVYSTLVIPSTGVANDFGVLRDAAGGSFNLYAGALLKLGGVNLGGSTTLGANNFPQNYTTITLNATSTVEYYGGIQTVYATPTYGHLTLSTSGTKTAGAALTVVGNLLINSPATFAAGASLTHNVGGNWTNNGTFSYTTGSTINFNTAGSKTISGSSATAFQNIIINKGSNVTNVMEANGVGALSNTGNITMTNGLFKMTTGTWQFNTSNPVIPTTAGIWINGATLNIGAFSTTNNGWVRVSSGIATFGTGSGNGIANQTTGYFDVSGGTVNIGGRLVNTASGTANTGVPGTGVAITGGTITVCTNANTSGTLASFNMSATSNLSMTNGTVIVQTPNTNGTPFNDIYILSGGTKSISGGTFQIGNASTGASKTFLINSAININNLTINSTNAPVLKLVTSNLTLGASGVLTMNGGNIDGAANSLTTIVTNSATGAVVRTAGYVNYKLKRAVATTSANYLWPVGFTTYYTPATYNFTNLTSGDLEVLAVNGDETNLASSSIDATKSVNMYWKTTPTSAVSTNYSGNYAWPAGLNDAAVTAASFQYGKFDAGTSVWAYPTISGTPTTTALAFTGANGLITNHAIGNCRTPSTATNSSTQTICTTTSSITNLGGNNPTVGVGTWSVVSGPSTLSSQFGNVNTYNTSFTPAGGAGSYVIQWTIDLASPAACSNPSIADATITVNSFPTWGNLQWPASGSICANGSYDIYGRVYEEGVTNASFTAPGVGIVAQFGYSTSNSNPNTWTNWSNATYNIGWGNNDEFKGTLSGLSAGTYYYAFRYALNNGSCYVYGGYNVTGGGFWDGSSNVNGQLMVYQVVPLVAVTLPIACNGGMANISVSGNGGTNPYIGTGNFTANAGTSSYTVTDANGCTASTSITVTQPTTLTAGSTSTSISCNGGSSTVTVTAAGGTGPYTGTGNFTVSAGTHNYTVTDANGCTATTSITVTQPTVLTAGSTSTSISCNGGSATVTVTAAGGTGPYTGTGSFSVAAGTYSYTITDANGCSASTSITVTQPTVLTASISSTPVLCNGGNSIITVSASGGTGPYTGTGNYTVSVGSYSYTVTDANGCTTSTSTTITEPSALTASSSATSISCFGGTAVVTVTATGGTTPYTGIGTYTVSAGTHSYTVTDINGCTSNTSIVVTQPAVVNAPTGAASQTFCSTLNATIASIQVTGTVVQWYASNIGGSALASTTPLSTGTTYYATQTIAGCESPSYLAVTVTIPVASTYYADADADGFGNVSVSQLACVQPTGYVLNNTDCNDAVATTYPGAPELCNGVDDNCSGFVDEGCPSTIAGEEPFNSLSAPSAMYSYCSSFYSTLAGAFPSTLAQSTCVTGEDRWYNFTTLSTGVTIFIGSNANDIVIELQDANGNLIDVENSVVGIGTEVLTKTGLTLGATYRVGIRNYNSNAQAGGQFSGCIRHLRAGGSDSGTSASWPSTL